MALPVPALDDRQFQDLVDDAKRLVAQRCPEWTDHNVSDPGVTLIEAVASMVDQLIYRLNRVPELHYRHFLNLLGVRPHPPTAARTDVTFRLSAAQPESVVVPGGTAVATPRTETEEPVVFTTLHDLRIAPAAFQALVTAPASGGPVDRTGALRLDDGIPAFSEDPHPGDALLVGLTQPVPGCMLLLRFGARVEGHGVDPRDPPWAWEAWDGEGWTACELGSDDTGGLNRSGDVVLHVPPSHTWSTVLRQRAGWLRCRVTPPRPGRPSYTSPPRVRALTAEVVGGTVPVIHAEETRDEVIGVSEGVPGQRFSLQHGPVVPGDQPLLVESGPRDDPEEWWEVDSFADSGPDDRHLVLDAVAGQIVLGPAVREPDGSLRRFGAVPVKGATLRVPSYRSGGGRRGNVARGRITDQRSPVPFVSSVVNRHPAAGGTDQEGVEDASIRGPLGLRTRERAVTREDYELLARQAAPDVARVRCVPATGSDAVRVLVVPRVDVGDRELAPADLEPSDRTLEAIRAHLDARRCLGARVVVEPPRYQGVTVVAQVTARRRATLERVEQRTTDALRRFLHPLHGGPDGEGWPFGRPVQLGEVFAVLQRVSGVEAVQDVQLFAADLGSGARTRPVHRLDLDPNALALSYDHQVRVDPS
ncbi:putative baseplate assembly protein [Actinomycetospora termitidis]|uniref:Baseplate assembly protein n=1 Tax=Actinomycetospora termitidis TaxID=3053470 RepID=A0ABT7M7B6_9PSEU|nr:putative baseplate assembly protein [Actinomycetospora sp. Odt1-22]MDL5156564.1 putative baseplate assembly protein [Actinomycetospora sp. Odt1-22]